MIDSDERVNRLLRKMRNFSDAEIGRLYERVHTEFRARLESALEEQGASSESDLDISSRGAGVVLPPVVGEHGDSTAMVGGSPELRESGESQ